MFNSKMKMARSFTPALPSATCLFAAPILFVLLCASGCGSGGNRAASPANGSTAFASVAADSCCGRDGVPGPLTGEELAAKRAANLILADYLWLDGEVIRLALTAEEAASLGVSGRHYAEALEEIAVTNRIVREHLAAGDTIPIDIPARPRKTFPGK